jgi:hypothetical protein
MLASDVRHFASTLPPAWTDRERLAAQLIRFVKTQRSERTLESKVPPVREMERTR